MLHVQPEPALDADDGGRQARATVKPKVNRARQEETFKLKQSVKLNGPPKLRQSIKSGKIALLAGTFARETDYTSTCSVVPTDKLLRSSEANCDIQSRVTIKTYANILRDQLFSRPYETWRYSPRGRAVAHRFTAVADVANTYLNRIFPILDPFSRWIRTWNVFLALLVLYLTYALPYEMATEWRKMGPVYEHVNTMVDIIFIIDIVINFRTALVLPEEQKLLYKTKDIAIQYMSTWFIFDLVAVIPWELIASDQKMLHMNHLYRFPRLVRVTKILRVVRGMSLYVGVVLTMISLVTAIHVAACALLFVLKPCTDIDGNLRPECQDHFSAWVIYRQVIYVALSFGMGSFGGYTGIITKSLADGKWNTWCDLVCYSTAFSVVVLVAIFFASFATFLRKRDARGRAFSAHMTWLEKEMEKSGVAESLQARVYGYYDYIYLHQTPLTLLSDTKLSEYLRRQLAYHMFGSFLDSVPLFRKLDLIVRMRLCARIRPAFFLPKEQIITRGDLGSEMFFVQSGHVAVINDRTDPPSMLATFDHGDYFGQSVIWNPTLRRTTTIIALCLSHLLCLSASAFKDVDELFTHFHDNPDSRLKNRDNEAEGKSVGSELEEFFISDSDRESSDEPDSNEKFVADTELSRHHVRDCDKRESDAPNSDSVAEALNTLSTLEAQEEELNNIRVEPMYLTRSLSKDMTTRILLHQSTKDEKEVEAILTQLAELWDIVNAIAKVDGIEVTDMPYEGAILQSA